MQYTLTLCACCKKVIKDQAYSLVTVSVHTEMLGLVCEDCKHAVRNLILEHFAKFEMPEALRPYFKDIRPVSLVKSPSV